MKFGFHKTLVAALLLAAPTAGMGSDVSFAYQGLLLDEVGNQLSEPNHSIVFRIYDQPAGGLPLWSCTRNVLLDGKGQFSVEISGNAPSGESLSSVFAAHASSALYIGLTVDNDEGEIAPRQKLMSVPKAVWATDSVAAKNDMAVAGSLHGAAASLQSVQQVRSLVASNRLECGLLQVGSLSNANKVPDGWALCNGETHYGIKTPNLLSRFIVGAGSGSHYKVGEAKGEALHTLTEGELPAHSHACSFRKGSLALVPGESKDFLGPGESSDKYTLSSNPKTWVTQAHENRPPFYALCYIMRVQ